MGGVNGRCSPYATPKATQVLNSQYNFITMVSSQTINGVNLPMYGVLSLTCNSVVNVLSTCQRILAKGAANFNPAPTMSIKNVQFGPNFLAQPLFPNEQVMDFILCFRYDDN